MMARTRVRVSSDTAGEPFRTRDTVATPTPARLATSAIVTFKWSLLRQPSRAVEPLPSFHKAWSYVNASRRFGSCGGGYGSWGGGVGAAGGAGGPARGG